MREKNKTVKDQLGQLVGARDELAPAVILVRPQLGENIGAATRAMLNFGLNELRLVSPRDGWPNPAANAMAAGASPVLDGARLYESVKAALADIEFAVAATARRRELEIPVWGTDDAAAKMRELSKSARKTAILFGPEKAGLTNDDTVLCDGIITYPVNPAFQSLNLAQAVGVFSYIWAASAGTQPPAIFDDVRSPAAPRGDLVNLFEHIEDELSNAGFFHPPEKRSLMARNIRAPLTRAQMSTQEVRTWRGIIKALSKGRGRASGGA